MLGLNPYFCNETYKTILPNPLRRILNIRDLPVLSRLAGDIKPEADASDQAFKADGDNMNTMQTEQLGQQEFLPGNAWKTNENRVQFHLNPGANCPFHNMNVIPQNQHFTQHTNRLAYHQGTILAKSRLTNKSGVQCRKTMPHPLRHTANRPPNACGRLPVPRAAKTHAKSPVSQRNQNPTNDPKNTTCNRLPNRPVTPYSNAAACHLPDEFTQCHGTNRTGIQHGKRPTTGPRNIHNQVTTIHVNQQSKRTQNTRNNHPVTRRTTHSKAVNAPKMKNGETPIVQSSNVPDKPRNPCNNPTNIPKLPPKTLPRTYQNPCEKQQIYVSQYQNSSPMYAKQNLPVSTASRYQDIIEQCRSSYNTPNHSFELYNKLLDQFYKFCDTVLAKHGLDKTTPLQKRQVEQNELVRNATMDTLNDEVECRLCRSPRGFLKPHPMRSSNYQNQFGKCIREMKDKELVDFMTLKSSVKKNLRTTRFHTVSTQTFKSDRNVSDNDMQLCKKKHDKAFTNLARMCFSSCRRVSEMSKLKPEDVFKIILPDNCDVSGLKNKMFINKKCPLIGILKTGKKNYFKKSNNYYEITLKANNGHD
ncbi:hypothetical protein M8J76_002193 [Diaphorina citri]|nr:hypothetical protein M8J76_002193 [Diaphorina citri]